MLVLTGIMLGAVLLLMAGEQAREMQLALDADDTDSIARECDSRLGGVVLDVPQNPDIDSPGNRRRPGDRVIFVGAALILWQLPSSPRTGLDV